MTLKMRLQIIQWRLEDSLRHSLLLRSLVAVLHWAKSRVSPKATSKITHLAKALALTESGAASDFYSKDFRELLQTEDPQAWHEVIHSNPRYSRILRDEPQLTRSAILKAPGPNQEKGVLLTYFEYNLARVLSLPDEDLRWLDSHYHLVFVASWSPTDYALIGTALLRIQSPLFIQCANERERQRLSSLHPRLVVLPGLACDWVDPVFYRPKSAPDRRIDLLMVANWGAFKRHWEFFLSLKHMPADLRVVLVGQKEGGRDRAYIERMAKGIGVPQKLELLESLDIDSVTKLQCDARVSVILSRREGGCVAAVESLFAGCALAMRSDAHIGSSAHIHEETGCRLRPVHIASDLLSLLARSRNLLPQNWARAHIRNDLTLSRINETLRQHAVQAGQTWIEDMAIPRWRPHPTLASDNDQERLRSSYEDMHQRFPSLVSAQLMKFSHR